MLPPFSIVIPCFNEEGRIGETLRVTIEYLAANAPESELIVVNDGSTDANGRIARQNLIGSEDRDAFAGKFSKSRKGRCGSLRIACRPRTNRAFF